ncbi:MAG TPA: uroporphyrinogen-III synthase [Flavitalea sp.]|nr:uroporphyrinogen-III synthase [Flavitalea sp.]
MTPNIQVLSTKLLDESLIFQSAEKNITIDCIPFIKTENIVSYELHKRISIFASESKSVIFTSARAVEAVHAIVEGLVPQWKVFCTSPTTEISVRRLLPSCEITGTASNAIALAEVISSSIPVELLFFCGDQRRDELPSLLNEKEYKLEEVVVYKTVETTHEANKSYDAILFFSPSAVNSYFLSNRLSGEVICFAIGNTTADAITAHEQNNKSIVIESPSAKSLIESLIAYFDQERAQEPKRSSRKT